MVQVSWIVVFLVLGWACRDMSATSLTQIDPLASTLLAGHEEGYPSQGVNCAVNAGFDPHGTFGFNTTRFARIRDALNAIDPSCKTIVIWGPSSYFQERLRITRSVNFFAWDPATIEGTGHILDADNITIRGFKFVEGPSSV
jgi:hypothetical protein